MTSVMTTTAPTALLIGATDEPQVLAGLMHALGFEPVFGAADDRHGTVALGIVDLKEPRALRTIRLLRSNHPAAVVVGLADPDRPTAASDAIRAGAFDVLSPPLMRRDLETILGNAREQAALASGPPLAVAVGRSDLIAASSAMIKVQDIVRRAAVARCGILICGERGTGRESIARAIHAHGVDRDAAFVRIDGASPSVELDLFGTPASVASQPDRRGIERLSPICGLLDASGGILFLEHVTEMPPRVQARLMRVLRDRAVVIGDSEEPVTLDVRPIASVDTTIDIAVEEGRVGADLFERLSLIRIDVPPLRMRREDIPALASHLLKDICDAHSRPLKTLTRSAMTVLSALPWRGNATELRALLERLMLLVPAGLIRLEDVLAHTQLDASVGPIGADATLRKARARFERDYIATVLQHHHGRVAEAARVLGIQRTNLYRKMRRLNLLSGPVQRREV